jgi:hypothetical protein
MNKTPIPTCIKSIVYILVAMFAFFNFQTSFAATSQKTNLSKIINTADLIVHGVFSSVNSEWVGNKIITKGIFDISQSLKGIEGNSIIIKNYGGTAQHPALKVPVTMKISNGVVFSAGDERVLMLKRLSDKSYQIMGGEGNISILKDSDGKKGVAGMRKIHSIKDAVAKNVTISSELMTIDEFYLYIKLEVEKQ